MLLCLVSPETCMACCMVNYRDLQASYLSLMASAGVQSGTPAKTMASARGSSAVPKENVPANTGAAVRSTGTLRPKGPASDNAVADLTEQVHATHAYSSASLASVHDHCRARTLSDLHHSACHVASTCVDCRTVVIAF